MDEYAKKSTLQDMTKQVIADKMLMKAVENYAEKNNRDVLMVTEFDNSAEIVISSRIRRKLEKQPELVRALKELFENEDADDHDEDFKLFSSKRYLYQNWLYLLRMLREDGISKLLKIKLYYT